ncbi:zinc transporter ZIP13 isoform X1 [Lates japonicus]|uniref:Zinc transporter ZIP13 isoform X1 n=1 Tax=Lates japonicus TaxID=270547 RepID=A0AAD3QWG5_LATJO|nr:zinc transporter ZIP13 isoform X1 [Lates japonicus]
MLILIRGCFGKALVTDSYLCAAASGSQPSSAAGERAQTQRRKPASTKPAWMAGTHWCKDCRNHKHYWLQVLFGPWDG